MQAQDIFNTINVIAEKLFKAVESQVYTTLDQIVMIGPEILKKEPLKRIFQMDQINGLMVIAQAFILFFIVYYAFSHIILLYQGGATKNIYAVTLRLITVSALVASSFFLCDQLLHIFSLFSEAIDVFATSLVGHSVSFEGLKEAIISMKDFMKNDVLSLDGIIKGMVSFGAVSVLIQFAIRYVTMIFLLCISPFAFVSLGSDITAGLFFSWGKQCIVNLSMQVIVKLLIMIPLLYKNTNSVVYKIILVGTIYLIYRIPTFAKEILQKISSPTTFSLLFEKENGR